MGLGFLRQSTRCGAECSPHLYPARTMEANCFLGLLKVLRNVCVTQSRLNHLESFSKGKHFQIILVCLLLN